MLKIEHSKDTLTVDEFVKAKKYSPYAKWRRKAKAPNFGCLFGAGAEAFAGILTRSNFTEADCDDFIKDMGLQSKLNEAIIKNQISTFKRTIYQIKLIVCADSMRTSFFKAYPGFMSRIWRERAFAYEHGYVRTYQGPVRHLGELKYLSLGSKPDENGKRPIMGMDKSLYSKLYGGLVNDAVNSTIQSLESNCAFATWYEIERHLRMWHMKSYIFNNIHDSLDFEIYKPEAELVIALSNACSAWDRPPTHGIHMSFEPEVSDISDMDHRNSTFWKHGIEVPTISIEEALEHYNKKNGTNWKWDGCDVEFDYLLPDWYRRHGQEPTNRKFAKVDPLTHNNNRPKPDKEFKTKNGCKVSRKFCREGGNRSYFLNCSDFNSLEARCAAQDTFLNSEGIDPVLLNLYKDGGTGDLHSMTAWQIYVEPFKKKALYVTDLDNKNKQYILADNSQIKVLRDGKKQIVYGKDLKETDKLIDIARHSEDPTIEQAVKEIGLD